MIYSSVKLKIQHTVILYIQKHYKLFHSLAQKRHDLSLIVEQVSKKWCQIMYNTSI
jgi:hypothetical protein